MSISRRGFVKVAATLPVVAGSGCGSERDAAAVGGDQTARVLDPETLRAVADVVLPGELGATGMERAVAGFEAWVAAYRPVMERDHGYGTAEIRYTGPDPAPGWKAQLEAWDLEARARHGVAFHESERTVRESFVRGELRAARSLGDPAQAGNPALALLSWWAATPDAADLCHGVAIGRETCRPLSAVGEAPGPANGSSA